MIASPICATVRRRVAQLLPPTALLFTPAGVIAAGEMSPPQLSSGQSHYLESCGGCHGIQGVSTPRYVPELRGSVGRFLCSGAGRQYLVRLPNVAFAAVDDQALTDLLNFMVFQLGGASTPAAAKPYSRVEVAQLRRKPFKSQSLQHLRTAALAETNSRCRPSHAQ